MKSLRHCQPKSSGPGARSGHISPLSPHLTAASGDFVGTFFFLWTGYSGQTVVFNRATAQAIAGGLGSGTVVFTALVYGLSLRVVNAWAFYRISGGLFNPAVSLRLSLSGQVPWLRTVFLVPAQVLASMCAGGLVGAMFGADLSKVNTILAPGTSAAQGLFIEMFMTAQLVFAVLMLATGKSRDTFIAPLGIGLALFVAELTGVYYTGGSLNPARSFGCAVAGRSFPSYHWIYWIGPALGVVLAALYYRFVKWAHYEEANPGQDSDGSHEQEVA